MVGLEYGPMMWNHKHLDEALNLLRSICEPIYLYTSDLIILAMRSNVEEKDAIIISHNAGKLIRLCAVECYLIGVDFFRA